LILANVGDFLETARPWLSPVFLCGILGVVSLHYYRIRNANLADRKLDLDVETILRSEIKELKDEVRKCEGHRDDDREKIWALKDLCAGLNRVILANSAAGVLVIDQTPDGYVSDEVRRATLKVEELFKGPR